MSERETMPPLISTSSAGPSGIMHLPRIWLKIRMHAAGCLAEGYRHGSGGYDDSLFEHFGVDGPAFVAYIESELPDYLNAERWFLKHAKTCTPETISSFNAEMIAGTFSDPARAQLFRDRVGLTDAAIDTVIALNDLDDWLGIHEVLKRSGAATT